MDISEFSRLEDKNAYSRHPWEVSRKDVLLNILKKSGIAFPVDRIVDIGSGDAYVIHTLLKKGIAQEYYAIDTAYTPEVISQLKANNNNSNVIYVQNLQEYLEKYRTEASTLYLCMDVLEHLQDESEVLSHLRQEKNNLFFFAVPAFQSVFSNHDTLLGHYRRYTLPQLESVLKSFGFTITTKGYYFTSLLIFRWIDKLLNKDKEASIDNWEGSKLKNNLMNTILKIDFSITSFFKQIGFNIYGLSCYCLCKK